MTAPPPPPQAGDRIPLCGGKYDLLTGSPLPAFDQQGYKAFSAQAGRGGNTVLALVSDLKEFPRYEMLANAANINTLSAFKLLDSDVVFWPEFGKHRPVLIYERPAGQRWMTSLTEEKPGITNELTFRQAVESIYEGLRDSYLAGVSHGRINTLNIYTRDAGSGLIQLGDSLMTQPGKYQPAAFETIERMMAMPAGRGPTSAPEDIYAAGVTLLIMLLGKLPALAMDSESLLQAKIEKGSMMALIAGTKLPSAFSEIFRGMLADDENQRWGLDDISHWLGGRRMGSKPAGMLRKAQRGMEFDGKGYHNPRLLALAMSRQPDLAAKIIEDGSLDRWVRRSIGDEELATELANAIVSASGLQRGGNPAERLTSRVCIALDPPAPIRFRDVSAMPNGFGPLLAHQMINGQPPRCIADVIVSHLVIFWLNAQKGHGGESSALMQLFEGQRMLLDRSQFGFGPERVLYELNPNMPCISPMVEARHPLSLKTLAIALETYAETAKDSGRDPMDRHIAAFVLARHHRMNDRLFPLLSPNSGAGQRAIAILTVMAELQKKFYTEPMPHMAEWVAKLLGPAIDAYNNKTLRERLHRDIKKLAHKGDLDGMLSLIDDGNLQKHDVEGYNAARNEWRQWEAIARELGSNSESRRQRLLTLGRQVTAFAAAAAAILVLTFTIYLKAL